MTEGANAELIRDLFAVGNREAEVGQIDAWLDFYSEQIEWEAIEDAPDAGTYRGHDGIRGYFEDWMATMDGINWEVRGLADVDDSTVVADLRVRARVKGTDAEMKIDYSQAMRVADGKITHIKEFREHDDALAFAEASTHGNS
jgi:ketosteroid isomerase-like protein